MNRIWLLLLLVGSVHVICTSLSDEEADYDIHKTFAEYAASYGYSFEVHKAVTSDGYLLTLWRIPKKINERRQRRPPVLLQHGLMDNGFSWLFKRIDHNLAIILADAGYDVWIGNNRGTIQSLEHRNIKEYNWRYINDKYWDFSFDEMGIYDLPAMIDYILDATDHKNLTYIGHSQGTSQFFAKTTINPEYINSKVNLFVGLSPVLYVKNAPGLFGRFLAWSPLVDILYALNLKNFWTFPAMLPINSLFIKYFPRVLPTIVQFIAGWTKNQTMDISRMRMVVGNEPGGTSAQNLLHWMQLIRNGGFRMFDFGVSGNQEKYGQSTPPEYNVTNLKKLTIPIHLMVGKSDSIIGWNDLSELLSLLPKGHSFEEIDDYGHLDYIWADNAHVKVYPQILKFIKQHLMKS